eukprot:TRINITY_DN5054_c0_g1_i1.p1 TRINITY_DN5054_c0_g1~~TRINITY_DN5054_c0_g1_i1.p1  ORF type:complete len:583 (+),score=80.07 TRINITY_DN5054_c0_g1_i1:83-1831(+)
MIMGAARHVLCAGIIGVLLFVFRTSSGAGHSDRPQRRAASVPPAVSTPGLQSERWVRRDDLSSSSLPPRTTSGATGQPKTAAVVYVPRGREKRKIGAAPPLPVEVQCGVFNRTSYIPPNQTCSNSTRVREVVWSEVSKDPPVPLWDPVPFNALRASWSVLPVALRDKHNVPLGARSREVCQEIKDAAAAQAALPPHLQIVGEPREPVPRGDHPPVELWKRTRAPRVEEAAFGAPLPCLSDRAALLAAMGQPVAKDLADAIIKHEFMWSVARALLWGRAVPEHPAVIPVWVSPVMLDAKHAAISLAQIDVPVRQFVFVRNWNESDAVDLVNTLALMPFGVSVLQTEEAGKNDGFAASMNQGIVEGFRLVSSPPPAWFALMNCDVRYPSGELRQFAYYANQHWERYGYFFPDQQEHFAFGISRRAVDAVGLMDETFFPAYMEDVDYHWRVRLCGLGQIMTPASFRHCLNANLNGKPHPARRLLRRGREVTDYGFQYGKVKWGNYDHQYIYEDRPPALQTFPFAAAAKKANKTWYREVQNNISLSTWAVDPEHRACIHSAVLSEINPKHCIFHPVAALALLSGHT